MRVLLANKFFHPGAGAETSFLATRDLLKQAGNEVIDFAMADDTNLPSPHSSYFAVKRSYEHGAPLHRRAVDAAASIYSLAARRAIRRLVREQRPEIAHLHNVYHQLTLSIVDELVKQRVPVVMTLHDSKIVCPAYSLYTDGQPCRRCVASSPVHVITHKCVKDSRAASVVAAAEALVVRTRGLYRRMDGLIAPSRFIAELASQEVPKERVHVVPNFLPTSVARKSDTSEVREPVALFAGRLEVGKGIRPLLAAFSEDRGDGAARLVIAGDGPLRSEVRIAAATNPRIEFVGRIPRDEVNSRLRRAAVMVIPSLFEENCPMTVLEARAAGAAVVCASTGGLPELVEHGLDGLLVDARSARSIGAAVQGLIDDPQKRSVMAQHGLARFERDHTPERHLERLLAIYRCARPKERFPGTGGKCSAGRLQ